MSEPRRLRVIVTLGTAQTLAWASSYYLPAILARPIAADLNLSPIFIYAALSGALMLAGLIGPRVGALIDQLGGRGVLCASNLVLAAGLLLLGAAQGPAGLVAAWLVLGLGMGMGLYDAAFAALVRIYGGTARRSITGITLIGGFASTLGWPVTAYLEARWGWRMACMVWAGVHLLGALPLNLTLPRLAPHPAPAAAQAGQMQAGVRRRWAMIALALVFAANSFVSTGLSALFPAVLVQAGATPAAAIFAAALVGPAQVAARLAEAGWLSRYPPLACTKIATLMNPLGVALILLGGPALAPVFTCVYGLGNGVLTIVRGTLPLAVFGAEGFGRRLGLLTMPARFAGAASPLLMGLALERFGSAVLPVAAAASCVAFLALMALGRIHAGAARGAGA